MINIVKCRKDRCCLERVFGVIFCSEYPLITEKRSLLGNIFNYQNFARYSYNNYEYDIQNKKITKPLIKVWTGR